MNSSQSHSLIEGLNNEQQQAVTTRHPGNILVLAGAGCGKTTVLTRRIAFLTSIGILQHRILALTFSRKAADEMASRVVLLQDIDRERPLPLITTFHGFTLRILKDPIERIDNFQRIGYGDEPKLLSQRKRFQILAAISTSPERRVLGVDIGGLDALIAHYMVFPEKLNDVNERSLRLIQEIALRFEKEKRKSGVWDFSDLQRGVLQLFSEYPEMVEIYATAHDAVLVDEFQDTNPIQIELIRYLLRSSAKLYAVGDDDQAIYGFRGADIRPITQFASHFDNTTIYKLQTNYRSVPAILGAANKIFAKKEGAYRKILRSGKYVKPLRGKFYFRQKCKDSKKMADWILSCAHKIHKREGIPISHMAILFRLNHTKEWTMRYFETDSTLPQSEYPLCMTIHGSKGLEFPVVFLCDLEEGIFPHYRNRSARKKSTLQKLVNIFFRSGEKEIEEDLSEEQRLFYVGVTRAQRYLYLCSVWQKELYGRKQEVVPSRFLKFV